EAPDAGAAPEPAAPTRRASRSERRAAAPAVPPPFVYEAPASTSPSAQLAAARVARDEGDVQGCISLARGASEAGAGPSADLLLGDCYLRARDQASAAKAYERF